jgi:hypothetical protein
MMSCTTSAWSRPISSPCYTKHGQCCATVLSGHITIVAMSRCGQLRLCCTVEPNCSGLSACLAGTSVTRDRALDTCEPSYVPRQLGLFYFCGPQPTGAVGYMVALELSSRGGEAGATW